MLPHDQNTSGFFITILKKIKHFDDSSVDLVIPPLASKHEEVKVAQDGLPLQIQKKTRLHSFAFLRCDPKDPDIEYLKAYYGLREDFPVDQLITQSDDMNKLYFISPQISRFLYADTAAHHLNIINMGVSLFYRNISKFSSNTECIFRISQDGILNVIPYMSKRIVWVKTEEQFKVFLMSKNLEVESIQDEDVKEEISNLSTGCFVLAIKVSKKGTESVNVEGIVMHKFPRNVNMMVSRENIFGLHLRYLNKEERESVAEVYELDK